MPVHALFKKLLGKQYYLYVYNKAVCDMRRLMDIWKYSCKL